MHGLVNMQPALAPLPGIGFRVIGGQHQHGQPLAFAQEVVVVGAEAEVRVAHGDQLVRIDDADELYEIVRELNQMVGRAPGLPAERCGAESEIREPIPGRGKIIDGDDQMVDAPPSVHDS